MENKEIKTVEKTTKTNNLPDILNLPLYIGSEEYDPKDIVKFVVKQSGLQNYTNTEILYIVNTCKEKGLNPMKGEISFFKARNGMLQAIPKYTTQLDLLWREFKKDEDFLTYNVFIEMNKDTQEWVATAKAEFINPTKGKYSKEMSLFSGDWKCSNGMVRFMLQKQANLQFIRTYYPHIDLGYEEEELRNFNSGFNEKTKPMDHRNVDIQVQPKTMEELVKGAK